MKLAFIGIGVMGESIARNLMRGGHDMVIFNRTRQAGVERLLSEGAKWASSPQAAAACADVVFTMVGYPKDVEEVYCGENGVFAGAQTDVTVVDMTTSSPVLAKKLAAIGADKKIDVLDAPVSGGDIGAKTGRLSVMVGGSDAAFQKIEPLLRLIGQKIVRQGDAGAGQYTKMVNQIVIASNMMGVVEALCFAKAAGLNQERVLDSIADGAAGSAALSNLGPRMLMGDFAPGFYIKHFIKDMGIAIASAAEMKLNLPALTLANSLYGQLAAEGMENEGTQALYRFYLTHYVNATDA